MNDSMKLQELVRKMISKGYEIVDSDYGAVILYGRIVCGLDGTMAELTRTLNNILESEELAS